MSLKWLKKIFGVKDKVEEKPDKSYIPKDLELEERKISPLLTEEQPLSVPIEENYFVDEDKGAEVHFEEGKLYPITNPAPIVRPALEKTEEPIAPTLERQDEIVQAEFPIKTNEPEINFSVEMENGKVIKIIPPKKKSTKPKKQAKKKDNFNDDASKPKGRNFLM